MKKIKELFRSSYVSDKKAFYLEMASFSFHMIASMTLALSAKNPNLVLVYPFSIIGGVCAFLSIRRRRLAWPLITTMYAISINIFGFLRATNVF